MVLCKNITTTTNTDGCLSQTMCPCDWLGISVRLTWYLSQDNMSWRTCVVVKQIQSNQSGSTLVQLMRPWQHKATLLTHCWSLHCMLKYSWTTCRRCTNNVRPVVKDQLKSKWLFYWHCFICVCIYLSLYIYTYIYMEHCKFLICTTERLLEHSSHISSFQCPTYAAGGHNLQGKGPDWLQQNPRLTHGRRAPNCGDNRHNSR